MRVVLRPIGYVHNDYPPGQRPQTWQGTVSRIEFEPRWTEALSGLDGFSHVIVLCYLHLSQDEESPTRIRAQRHSDMPLVGFFGTRTPVRPNPISVTTVSLVERSGNFLHVRNLDMHDGTPVLDVKPYLIRGDCHPEATAPEWIYRLWHIHDRQRRDQRSVEGSGGERPNS
jgi:tRNA-Thr(GGU) m(6)t(6)A37 methyltransferase TsaA